MARGVKPAQPKQETGLLTRAPYHPEWLPEHAVKIWKRVGSDLVKRRVLAHSDIDMFTSYVVATANIQTIMEGKGSKALGTLNQNMQMQARLAQELGLTPSARAKVGTDPEDIEDDLSDLGL